MLKIKGIVSLALCLGLAAASTATAAARRKVIIDQDAFGPGGSNLQAILLVLQSPDVEVLEYLFTPRLEFNFRWDPEATKIVLHSAWPRLTQVPVDPTTKTLFTLFNPSKRLAYRAILDEIQHVAMETSVPIQCPFCGQKFDLVVDTSIPVQRFTTDCEICCRPFEVFAECEAGEVTSLDVTAD